MVINEMRYIKFVTKGLSFALIKITNCDKLNTIRLGNGQTVMTGNTATADNCNVEHWVFQMLILDNCNVEFSNR